ncbi:MAG: hypothetical protein ACOYK6_01240 [Chthoniobacterales bacterium]
MNPANILEEIPLETSQKNTPATSQEASKSAPEVSERAPEVSEPTPQEVAVSVVQQNPVKLNLPPKPILASTLVPPAADFLTKTSSSSSTQDPSSMPSSSSSELSSTLEIPLGSTEFKEENTSQKKFFITLPLAFLFFLIALFALLTQLRFFVNK